MYQPALTRNWVGGNVKDMEAEWDSIGMIDSI